MSRFLLGAFQGLLPFVCVLVSSANALDRKQIIEKIQQMRPEDLVILIKHEEFGNKYLLGMYALEKDDEDQELRRFRLWEESADDLKIYSESARCSTLSPLRVKRKEQTIYIRRINPGGFVGDFNREDHLVWWAACAPEFSGLNPETLKNQALSLGYSTELAESQEVLFAPTR